MKETKKSTKKPVPKKTKKIVESKEQKKSWKEFFQSLTFLKIVFRFLILVIIILSICIHQKKSELEENPPAHMIVPVIAKESKYEFGIDTLELSKEETKEYVFKITNYKENKINQEEITYYLLIENPTSAEIRLTRNEEDKDILEGNKALKIEEKMKKK